MNLSVTAGHTELAYQGDELDAFAEAENWKRYWSGKLRPLMVTTKERVAVAPDAPTASELGYPQLERLVGWSGLFGPPNMPEDVTAKLRDMLQKVKEDKAWNKFTKALGSVPYILDGPATKEFVDGQFNAFNDLVKKLDMKIK